MRRQSVLVLAVAGMVLLVANDLFADLSDNFDCGLNPDLWHVIRNDAAGAPWTIETSDGQLRFSKPEDTDDSTALMGLSAGVSSLFALDGDFSVSVDFDLTTFPYRAGQGANQVYLAVSGLNGSFGSYRAVDTFQRHHALYWSSVPPRAI